MMRGKGWHASRVWPAFAMLAATSCSLVFGVDAFDDHVGPGDAADANIEPFDGDFAVDGAPVDGAPACPLPPVREGLLAHHSFDVLDQGGFTSCLPGSPFERLEAPSGSPTLDAGSAGSAFAGGACMRAQAIGTKLPQPFTLAGWVHATAPGTIVSQTRGNFPAQGGWTLEISAGGDLNFVYATDLGAENILRANAPFPTGETTHVAVAIEGGDAVVYVRGVAQVSRKGTGLKMDTASTFTVGCNSNGGEPLKGLLDELSIYDRALDAAEIRTLSEWPPR